MGIETEPLAVVPLDAEAARDPAVAGAKAANLARAAAAGLPVLPGFVLVAADRAPDAATGPDALRTAWERLTADTFGPGPGPRPGPGPYSGRGPDPGPGRGPDPGRKRSVRADGRRTGEGTEHAEHAEHTEHAEHAEHAVGPADFAPPAGFLGPADPRGSVGSEGIRAAEGPVPLVVRSSSAHEDTEDSSMAGRFESVLDVRGWEAFTLAVRRVLDSALRYPPVGEDVPLHGMAVLVQPMLDAVAGGVMFGADPVEGRYDHILVSAVTGGPDRLVDGSTQGVRYQLTRRGRLLHTAPRLSCGSGPLGHRRLVQLVRLARRTENVYGGPQDVEFGFDAAGRLWLFQARPITAMAARPLRGARLLGPGPVAETLPDVLQPLEEDLWLAPMNQGLTLALDIAGAAPRRKLRRLPVATVVDGRAAADLVLLGAVPAAHPVLHFMNPAPGARRAAAAWRIGRLRTALPLLARDLMADVDRQLHDFAEPRRMLSGELLTAAAWGRTVLASLHAQESLAGALLETDTGSTAAGEALAVLAEGRAGGHGDDELIGHHPVLLSLLAPSLDGRPALPARVGWNGVPRGVGFLSVREGLRLRVRWVQEMQSSMVREIGSRIDAHCAPEERDKIGLLRWRELVAVADGGPRPADFAERLPRPRTTPLPASFRLADGRPQAVSIGRKSAHEGQGAGGGQGTGTAWDGTADRPGRPVLVVHSLDPGLAPLLPGLAGLVAETGSVLSHLAVLAREYQVPTVVGVPRAVERYAPGTGLTVDGGTGAVEVVAGTEEGAQAGTVGMEGDRAADGDTRWAPGGDEDRVVAGRATAALPAQGAGGAGQAAGTTAGERAPVPAVPAAAPPSPPRAAGGAEGARGTEGMGDTGDAGGAHEAPDPLDATDATDVTDAGDDHGKGAAA